MKIESDPFFAGRKEKGSVIADLRVVLNEVEYYLDITIREPGSAIQARRYGKAC